MFIDILKSGKKITISGGGYVPTTFYTHGSKIWIKNSVLGTFPHEEMNKRPLLFEEHIQKMLQENLIITIK